MKQKIVIKVRFSCSKCRKKALKIAATANGIISVAIQGSDKDEIVIVGNEVDSVGLCGALRKKIGYANLLSVEEVKDPKPEDKKKEDEKKPAAENNDQKKDGKDQQEKNKEGDAKNKDTPPAVPTCSCPPPNYYQPPNYCNPNPQFYVCSSTIPNDPAGCSIM